MRLHDDILRNHNRHILVSAQAEQLIYSLAHMDFARFHKKTNIRKRNVSIRMWQERAVSRRGPLDERKCTGSPYEKRYYQGRKTFQSVAKPIGSVHLGLQKLRITQCSVGK